MRLAGWIANDIEESPDKYHLSYISILKQRISALFLGEIPCCLMQHSAWTADNL
ncbi:hypothetical protein [Pantoea sp. Nvir]|uniref:hypothetical protein n=1 Tax=Pantoea sp. Nvir TaxID=2576760 RepID=UPI0013594A24|nr:hypothetical protein [Pantoea sp. Nvir]